MSAAEARMGQWAGIGEHNPGELIDELYEASPREAKYLADEIRAAIDVVNKAKSTRGELK